MPGVHKGGTPCGTLTYVVRPVLNGNASVLTGQMIHMRRAIIYKAAARTLSSNGCESLDTSK